MSDDELDLKLVGYRANTSHGYALPVFARFARANTLYLAHCSPSGDHLGRITGFEPSLIGGHEWLPEEETRPVRIGEPWVDVFLWEGRPYAGTPAELWCKLEGFGEELRTIAPLSLFDAALNAGVEDADELGHIALSYLARRHGTDVADRWRHQTVTHRMMTFIDRLGMISAEAGAQKFRVTISTDVVTLWIPSTLAGSKVLRSQLGRYLERLSVMLGLRHELKSVEQVSRPDMTNLSASDDPEILAALKRSTAATRREAARATRQRAAERVSEVLGLEFVRRGISSFESNDGTTRVVILTSRRHDRRSQQYWYGFYDTQRKYLAQKASNYLALCAIDTGRIWAVPASVLDPIVDSMGPTNRPNGQTYWHVMLRLSGDDCFVAAGGRELDISPFEI